MSGASSAESERLLVEPHEVSVTALEVAFAVAQCPPNHLTVMLATGALFKLPVVDRCIVAYAKQYPDNGPFEVRYLPRELFYCYHCGHEHE